nr:hypothetical protein CFP56_28148 [Quercus suber]
MRQGKGKRGKNKPSSSSSLFDEENLGTSTGFTELLLLRSDDLFHTKTKSPIITANDVVMIRSNAELMPVGTSTKTLVPIGPIFEIGFPGFPDAGTGQSCLKCTCCQNPSKREGCTTQQCCYSASCNIPQKPPGFCGISPIKCNCDSCSSA